MNPSRTTLYVGFTNNLSVRIQQHYDARGDERTFAGRFFCYQLVYFETFGDVNQAIAREKQIKGYSRKKKMDLVYSVNQDLRTIDM